MNKIILLGRLATQPELSYSQNGTAVCKFSLAVQRELDKQKADFFYCTTFGKLAQSVADYCPKGRQVLLDGRVEINVTQDQNGSRAFINVIANSVEFLAMPQNQSTPSYNQNQQPNNSHSNNHQSSNQNIQNQQQRHDSVMGVYNGNV